MPTAWTQSLLPDIVATSRPRNNDSGVWRSCGDQISPGALPPDRQGVVCDGESEGLACVGLRENHLLDVDEFFVYA
jgi:hypothetical protein